jgi:hypothetical protein
MTVDTDTQPSHILLVRGTASIEIVDGVPDEYLEPRGKHCLQSSGRVRRSSPFRLPADGTHHDPTGMGQALGLRNTAPERGRRAHQREILIASPPRRRLGLARHICRSVLRPEAQNIAPERR